MGENKELTPVYDHLMSSCMGQDNGNFSEQVCWFPCLLSMRYSAIADNLEKKHRKRFLRVQYISGVTINFIVVMLLSHYRKYVPLIKVLLSGRTASQIAPFDPSCSYYRQCNSQL